MFNMFRTFVLLAGMTALFMVVGYFIGGTGGMMVALAFAAATNLFAYWNSDKMVLRMQNAVPVERSRAPELYDMVDVLSRRAGIPTPSVYVIETEQPNAFATGRDPNNAAVAVSAGLLRQRFHFSQIGALGRQVPHQAVASGGRRFPEQQVTEDQHQNQRAAAKNGLFARVACVPEGVETFAPRVGNARAQAAQARGERRGGGGALSGFHAPALPSDLLSVRDSVLMVQRDPGGVGLRLHVSCCV